MTQSQSQQNQQKKELEAAYDEKVKAGDISHIEDKVDGYPIYFQKPQELVSYFDELEKKNIFLISMKQEYEQNIEEKKKQDKDIQRELTIKENALLEQKQHLMDQIEEIEANIKLAKKKTEENKKYTQQKDEDKFRIQIQKVYENFKDEI